MKIVLFLSVLCGLAACRVQHPRGTFDPAQTPPAPDFSNLENWAAHPDKTDRADETPGPQTPDRQAGAPADIFFLHPTSHLGGRKNSTDRDAWNASTADPLLNKATDDSPIRYQATIFNGAGRVFAPRYRQAHYHAFITKDKTSADKALEVAYADVKTAFEHYLKNWNGGRPIVIAAHSQGAKHAMRLLKEYFDGKDLGQKLVVAYIVGWPVPKDFFPTLQPCETPEQTGCYCSWRTFERDFGRRNAHQPEVVCTNPLTWTTEEGRYTPRTENRGAVLRNFHKPLHQICDAEVCRGVLLCTKPKFPGSFLFRRKNYHVGDFNLYYFDVRENVERRVAGFVGEK